MFIIWLEVGSGEASTSAQCRASCYTYRRKNKVLVWFIYLRHWSCMRNSCVPLWFVLESFFQVELLERNSSMFHTNILHEFRFKAVLDLFCMDVYQTDNFCTITPSIISALSHCYKACRIILIFVVVAILKFAWAVADTFRKDKLLSCCSKLLQFISFTHKCSFYHSIISKIYCSVKLQFCGATPQLRPKNLKWFCSNIFSNTQSISDCLHLTKERQQNLKWIKLWEIHYHVSWM